MRQSAGVAEISSASGNARTLRATLETGGGGNGGQRQDGGKFRPVADGQTDWFMQNGFPFLTNFVGCHGEGGLGGDGGFFGTDPNGPLTGARGPLHRSGSTTPREDSSRSMSKANQHATPSPPSAVATRYTEQYCA